MKTIKKVVTSSFIAVSLLASANALAGSANQLEKAIAGEHRSAASKARDQYRHPQQTLEFFGFKSSMTVVEITPGGGWYTEILAPALKGKGKLYGAHYPDTGADDYYSKSRRKLEKKLAGNAVFSEVKLTDFTPKKGSTLAPAGSVDMVLTFRNLHNWGEKGVEQVFKDAYKALKKGGVLGVVEHRLPEGADPKVSKGYVSQNLTIEQAKSAGFTLAAQSEINANPKDSAKHMVWALPPSLALKEKDREKYLAIGESDRMTLKFVKK